MPPGRNAGGGLRRRWAPLLAAVRWLALRQRGMPPPQLLLAGAVAVTALLVLSGLWHTSKASPRHRQTAPCSRPVEQRSSSASLNSKHGNCNFILGSRRPGLSSRAARGQRLHRCSCRAEFSRFACPRALGIVHEGKTMWSIRSARPSRGS